MSWERTVRALPLANDLSVGFDQIVRNISASQILQGIFVTDHHLSIRQSMKLNDSTLRFVCV